MVVDDDVVEIDEFNEQRRNWTMVCGGLMAIVDISLSFENAGFFNPSWIINWSDETFGVE